jgi:hypothetical protein
LRAASARNRLRAAGAQLRRSESVLVDVRKRAADVLAAMLAFSVLAATADATGRARHGDHRRALVFHHVADTDVMGSGRYVFIPSTTSFGGTIVDARADRRVLVPPPPGCATRTGTPIFGAGVLVERCSTLEVFRVQEGQWAALPMSSAIEGQCAAYLSPDICEPIAVGSDWLEFELQCYHCRALFEFQSLTTGAVRGDPTTSRVVPDLNSRELGHRLCQPIVAPSHGTVMPDGRFAIIVSHGLSVQRCGAHSRVVLETGPTHYALNHRFVVWLVTRQRHYLLAGRTLATGQHFVARLPAGLTYASGLVASDRSVYVLGVKGGREQSWVAPLT